VEGGIVARPLSRADCFWLGAGEAASYEVLTNTPAEKALRFSLAQGSVIYRVRANDPIPVVHVEVGSTNETLCSSRSNASALQDHGAWVTRWWVATEADGAEAFVDPSNPWIFGHSTAGELDVAYAFLPEVNSQIQRNGRTEKQGPSSRANTTRNLTTPFFSSGNSV